MLSGLFRWVLVIPAVTIALIYLALGVSDPLWAIGIATPVLVTIIFACDPTPLADARFTHEVGIGSGVVFVFLCFAAIIASTFVTSSLGAVASSLAVAALIMGGTLSGWRQHERSPGARGIAKAVSMSMIDALVVSIVLALVLTIISTPIACSHAVNHCPVD